MLNEREYGQNIPISDKAVPIKGTLDITISKTTEDALTKLTKSLNDILDNNKLKINNLTDISNQIRSAVSNGLNNIKLPELKAKIAPTVDNTKLNTVTQNVTRKSIKRDIDPEIALINNYKKAINEFNRLDIKQLSAEAASLFNDKPVASFKTQLDLARKSLDLYAKQYDKAVKSRKINPNEEIDNLIKMYDAKKADILENALNKESYLKKKADDKAVADKAAEKAREEAAAVQKTAEAYQKLVDSARDYYDYTLRHSTNKALTNPQTEKYNELKTEFSDFFSRKGEFAKETNETNALREQVYNSIATAQNNAIDKIINDYRIKLAKAKAEIGQDVGQIAPEGRYSGMIDEATASINRFEDEIKTISKGGNLDKIFKNGTKEATTFQENLHSISRQLTDIGNWGKNTDERIVSKDQLVALEEKARQFVTANPRSYTSYTEDWQNIFRNIDELGRHATVTQDDINGITKAIQTAQIKAQNAGKVGNNVLSLIDKQAQTTVASLMTAFATIDVAMKLREAFENAKQLNSQMIELSKVSNTSFKDIDRQFGSFKDVADEIGGTIRDTMAATSAWARNGYSLPDAKELARVSELYKNVGDNITIEEANESLVSTLQGFKMQAREAEHIIDVFNEVSNNEATSSRGIGEALQRSAASFQVANTSLEKSVALITAANCIGGLYRNM